MAFATKGFSAPSLEAEIRNNGSCCTTSEVCGRRLWSTHVSGRIAPRRYVRRREKCAPVHAAVVKMPPASTRSLGLKPSNWYMGRDTLELLENDMGFCNLLSKYNPKYVQQKALEQPLDIFRVMGRWLKIVSSLGIFFGNLYFDQWLRRADNAQIIKLRAEQLRIMLTDLGPSFIKAGQVLANRPDIMREDYMAELCLLQDDVPSFPDELAIAMIETQLGQPLNQIFSSISETPIAAASLGQVAVKVQRPGIEPVIFRDLFIFRLLATFVNSLAEKRLGCNAALIVDEFGEKLLEELDYRQEARNIEDFYANFKGDKSVKIPWVRQDMCGSRVLVMEWIDGIRCTDPNAIKSSGLNVENFIRCGVVSGLRQLLEFGLFHGDPHPGNIFALRDGRIAYVDFGNVAQLSQRNKQILIDAVVHAVNEDYREMAGDFIKLGFLTPGTDINPIIPALEKIWTNSKGQALATFNFRTVTSMFNTLVYQYPIRIPERYSLVIRSLLTQEGICMTLKPEFHFLEVAYPYVARRLLTDENPALRERLIQVLFQDGKFQWDRLENLIVLAKQGGSGPSGGFDLSSSVKDALKLLLVDSKLRSQLVMALTEDNRLHIREIQDLLRLVEKDINPQKLATEILTDFPNFSRQVMLSWADRVLVS